MSEKNCCCQKPENLKSKPEECSKEQIHKCHGDEKGHPCSCNDSTKDKA